MAITLPNSQEPQVKGLTFQNPNNLDWTPAEFRQLDLYAYAFRHRERPRGYSLLEAVLDTSKAVRGELETRIVE